ncbi:MAG TPA: sugar transferase [Phycisphaerae bacterium]|nr:sugar transferase [Phycisphaerae bacterium]HPU28471.1 sugar transferase [Phycisphaerae bacterium]
MKLSLLRAKEVWQRPRVRTAPAQLIMVVLDTHVPLLHGNGQSLLGLPFGTGSLLDELARSAEESDCDRIVVLRADEEGEPPSLPVRSHLPAKCMTRDEFRRELAALEPSDYLLIVDPACWPAAGYDFDLIVRDCRVYRGAMHALSIGSNLGAFREHIDCDETGRIRRVQRLYTMMNWPETGDSAQLCSLVPARAMQGIELSNLPALRRALISAGVFTQDIPIATDVFDLRSEQGILSLNETITAASVGLGAPTGWSFTNRGVLVGSDCRIHPSCRFVPPLVIHPDVTIEAGVTVIGPAVIGAGCRIQRDAFISHAQLAPGTIVPNRTVVTRTVAGGRLVADREYTGSFCPASSAQPDVETGVGRAISEQHRRKRLQFAIKRLMDIVISATALVVLAPFLVLVAIAVKLTSPGPVFFVHRRERMGEKGDFPCLKFRTMVSDAHLRQREMYQQNQVDGPQFKIDSDPRITRLGRILRATNVDELPQLINVLLGHMSLVGPRPSPFRENQICVPWRRARLSVRPGITGLWQLCRSDRHEGDFHQWIYYDMAYVRNFSLWLDFKILVLTALTHGGRRRVPLSRLLPHERMNG